MLVLIPLSPSGSISRFVGAAQTEWLKALDVRIKLIVHQGILCSGEALTVILDLCPRSTPSHQTGSIRGRARSKDQCTSQAGDGCIQNLPVLHHLREHLVQHRPERIVFGHPCRVHNHAREGMG